MKQVWVNVYEADDGSQIHGVRYRSRSHADQAAARGPLTPATGLRRVLVLRVRERPSTGRRKPKYEDMQGAI